MQSGGATLDEDTSSGSGSASSGEQVAKYMNWYLAGSQVCRRAFQRMLGIGNARLSRTRARFQGQDERTLKGQSSRSRAAVASASVEMFMQKMYYSISESMPTGCCSKKNSCLEIQ